MSLATRRAPIARPRAPLSTQRAAVPTSRTPLVKQRLLEEAVAVWKASRYGGGEYLTDLTGRGHDARLGSIGAARLKNRDLAKYLRLPGVSGNHASTPDAAALDITGDIDIRVKVALDDWTPAATSTFLSKWVGGGNQRAYWFRVDPSGVLALYWSADGTTVLATQSTVSSGIVDGNTSWVRATLDVDNGAGGRTATFYTSNDGVAWTQLGAAVVQAGTTSIFNSSSSLFVGALEGTANLMAGRVFNVQVRNGIGGTVAFEADFTTQTSGATSFVATTGQTVTINSTSGADTGDPLFLPMDGEKYVYMPGIIGNHVSIAHAAAPTPTVVDLRVRVALPAWPVTGAERSIVGGNSTHRGLLITTTGAIRVAALDSASTNKGATSNAVLPAFSPNQKVWIRGVKNWTTGDVSSFYSLTNTNDHSAVVWTQLGTTINVAPGTTPIQPSGVVVGSYSAGIAGAEGRYYAAAAIYDAETYAVDLTTATEPYSTLLVGGNSWAFVRTATGRKLAVVDRPMFLLGTDDFLEIPVQAEISSIAAGDSFTAMFVFRKYGTPTVANAALITNRGLTGSSVGWSMYTNIPADTFVGRIADGVAFVSVGAPGAISGGVIQAGAVVRNAAIDTVTTYRNVTSVNSANDTTTSGLENALPIYIGRSAGGEWFDGEFISAAVIRRALSAAEIARLGEELLVA